MTSPERLSALLRRFTRPEDDALSDRDFVLKVFERYQRYLAEPIIDVSE